MNTQDDTQKNTVGVPAVEEFGRSFFAESVLQLRLSILDS